jgi:glycosyltransferase involved in cell wall biosynthesis
VDPDDVAGLAAAMERVSFDDGLAAELRSRGLRRAADFSWTRSARTLLSELRTAAGSRPRPRSS